MTAEQASRMTESRGEVACGILFVEWFVEEAERHGETIPVISPTCA
jgi:acyl-CoA reductase-like NAD-dependent aldehyde dehydrogenase